MQTQAKIDGILSGHGGKPGTYYPDLELGNELWNGTRSGYPVPATNYYNKPYHY